MGSSSPAGHQVWNGIPTSGVGDADKVYNMGNRAHKPPTGVEISAIRAAQDLFLSSSFKLQVSRIVLRCITFFYYYQIDALLPNVRPKDSRKHSLDRFLFSLHACLSSLSSIEPRHPLAAATALSEGPFPSYASGNEKRGQRDIHSPLQTISVPYPLPGPTEDANWKVAFEKPANIAIVGSWINNVAVKRLDDEPWVIDVAVEMPSACLYLR